MDLPPVSPEIAKAAAAAFHAVGDYLQTGKPLPSYLIALLAELGAGLGLFLAVKKNKDKDE